VRYPVGILLGQPCLTHKIKRCPSCKTIYPFEHILKFIPPHGKYTFDIITEVGLGRYRYQKQNEEIQEEIYTFHKIFLPLSTISDIANLFLDYFAATHYANHEAICNIIRKNGGSIFHADGTCEAGTKVLFTIIDGITKLVLISREMSTENVVEIMRVFHECVILFGQPIASVNDLSDNINRAKHNVLSKEVLDLICQYHFLENVGDKLYKNKYENLNELLRKSKIKTALSRMRSSLVQSNKNGIPLSEDDFNAYLDNPKKIHNLDHVQLRRYLNYNLICWLNDSAADLKGEYYPFDLSTLVFFHRSIKVYDMVNEALSIGTFKQREVQTMKSILNILSPVRKDKKLIEVIHSIANSEKIFNEFRKVLRLNDPKNKPLLRQHQPSSTIKKALETKGRLIKFRTRLEKNLEIKKNSDKLKDAKICISYLDKYEKKLHGHVIIQDNSDKPILINRTNNIPEHLFGNTKTGWRRRLGTKKMAKHLQASRAEELLIENLKSQEYVDAIYNGDLKNMPIVFSKYWSNGKNIRTQLNKKINDRLKSVNKKNLRDVDFFKKIKNGINIFIKKYATA
jgi:hypothetical protein